MAKEISELSVHHKQIVTSYGEDVLVSPPLSDYSSLCPCNHEEADTRIFVHVADAVKSGITKILIKTVDTDVVVLAISVVHQLNLNELWVALGVSSSLRYIPAHEIANSLGPQKSRSLPVFHTYSGCDTVSAFHGKGKKSAWNTWSNFGDVTSAFQILSDSPASITEEVIKLLERFTILMYD